MGPFRNFWSISSSAVGTLCICAISFHLSYQPQHSASVLFTYCHYITNFIYSYQKVTWNLKARLTAQMKACDRLMNTDTHLLMGILLQNTYFESVLWKKPAKFQSDHHAPSSTRPLRYPDDIMHPQESHPKMKSGAWIPFFALNFFLCRKMHWSWTYKKNLKKERMQCNVFFLVKRNCHSFLPFPQSHAWLLHQQRKLELCCNKDFSAI